MSQTDIRKVNVFITIAMYSVLNRLFKLRWLLAAEVKSTLKWENLLVNFQHLDTKTVMKIYQDSTQIREAQQDLNTMSEYWIACFFLLHFGSNIAIKCHINKWYEQFWREECSLGTYDLLINFIINVCISLNASIRKESKVNTSQQTEKEQYVLQILFHSITGRTQW